MTKTSFADYVATQDARNTIELNVRKYCLMLCDCLLQDFYKKGSTQDYKFFIESGRKYHKIVMDANGSKSVHAFVDKKTGEVYKPASFKAPAKIVRYNLLMIESREQCYQRADWAGSYLYMLQFNFTSTNFTSIHHNDKSQKLESILQSLLQRIEGKC